ncbi:hypothetical protein [Nocardia sputi]|uniref:hypothetical protein n=1 Tax=Nocardia TaxID=1817 RepID=UPI0034E1ECD9
MCRRFWSDHQYNALVMERSERPWGVYQVLSEEPTFKVKTITVRPGRRLSYQRHSRRAEHWFVVSGEGVRDPRWPGTLGAGW